MLHHVSPAPNADHPEFQPASGDSTAKRHVKLHDAILSAIDGASAEEMREYAAAAPGAGFAAADDLGDFAVDDDPVRWPYSEKGRDRGPDALRFSCKVAGVSYPDEYGHHRQDVARKHARVGGVAVLVREPENPHDPNAVAVHLEHRRRFRTRRLRVGYLPRAEAGRLVRAGADFAAATARVVAIVEIEGKDLVELGIRGEVPCPGQAAVRTGRGAHA